MASSSHSTSHVHHQRRLPEDVVTGGFHCRRRLVDLDSLQDRFPSIEILASVGRKASADGAVERSCRSLVAVSTSLSRLTALRSDI